MRLSPLAALALVTGASASSLQAPGRAAPLAASQDSSWFAAASGKVERAEYHFAPVRGEADVWSAPNRSHDFRARLSAHGLDVFPRTTGADGIGAEWKLHLRTTSFGRTDGTFELPPPSVSANGERVELDHGALIEWFVNEKKGLEQGWTVHQRPVGAGKLWIGLAIDGDLSLRIDDGARSGILVDACGSAVLRYGNLLVFDAAGRELRAALRSTELGVGIAVEDAGAQYPLTVDPVLSGPGWVAESDQVNAEFGYSVASAGDVNGDGFGDVIVGANQFDNGQTNEGRSYVYLGSSSGLAASPAWMAESDQDSAFFGVSVASAGDVNGDGFGDVIVGAHQFDNGQTDEGCAFVYLGSAAGLATSPAWTAEGDQDGALFGESVASAGDANGDGYGDVIIGASSFDNVQADEGRTFVYLGSAAGLANSPAWTAEGDQDGASFGESVASAGDVNGDGYGDVIVGANSLDNGQANEGRAFVFLGTASGLAASPAWTAESNQDGASFGVSVASAGDVNGDGYGDMIVGAYFFDNSQSDEGRAFVYLGSSSGLATSPAWTAESDQLGAFFGWSVASAGDANGDGYGDVIVGAYHYDNGQADEGRAFVYLGSAAGLATSPAWTAESDQDIARFGVSVASAGDVNGDGYSDVIVGASNFDNGQADEGRAFVYLGSPSALATDAAWTVEGEQFGPRFGESVATAGDVNGDGYGDVIVGAPSFDNGQSSEGRAFLYLGSRSGLATSPTWTAEGDQIFAAFGKSVASAGDVNGDGFGDVIVGAPKFDSGQKNEGRALVYLGSPSGLAASPAWTAESNQLEAWFGTSVASAGDVNGDGFGDVIVGAFPFDNGQTDEGRAYVYLGSPSGLAASPVWTAESNQDEAWFGYSVASAGDVNRDGFGDVIVGAHYFDNGQVHEGRAYVYLGSPSGLATSPAWTAEIDQDAAFFGWSVASAGDVNGDGYGDVIIGAYQFSNGSNFEGGAFVYLGSAAGPATSPAWTAEGGLVNTFFGWSVASAGDVNGDGYGDVIIGAPTLSQGGSAFVYLGSSSGLSMSPAWTEEIDQDGAEFGHSVASAGDVNGDGYGDVILGAPYFDSDPPFEGRAFVHLGNDGYGGLVRGLQQRTRNGSRPLAVVGATGENGLFRIRCEFAKNAAGVAWLKSGAPEAWLEWEVKPLGVAFDGVGVRKGTAQALVPGGGMLTFDELASVDDAAGHARSTEARSYHWRARVATNSPLFPNTAWFSVQGSNITEAKLRKPARNP